MNMTLKLLHAPLAIKGIAAGGSICTMILTVAGISDILSPENTKAISDMPIVTLALVGWLVSTVLLYKVAMASIAHRRQMDDEQTGRRHK